jgi:hypothetical protein
MVGAAALLALSACSKKTDTAATGTASNTTATAPVASSEPLTPPARKAGLWEQTMSSDRINQTTRICLDDASEAKMKWWGSQMKGKTDCSEQKVSHHLGGGWDFHAVCAMGESGTITSDGQATGDFNSHYTVDITSTTSGSPMAQANGPHKMKIDASWKGACPTGWRGGDMEMPGGMKINMIDVMDGKGPLGAGGKMDPAQAAAMRKQAMEMVKQMKAQQKQ